MTTLISSFSHFSARTADRMGIPKDETLARACIDLLFNIMIEDQAAVIQNPLERNRFAEKHTAEWISPRYDAYKKFAPDFFRDQPDADLDAVIVAMLCTGYTDRAHVPADGNDDPSIPTVFKNDFIDLNIIERADRIIEEAVEIVDRVTGNNDDFEGQDDLDPKPESVYLAHGFLMDVLHQAGNDDYTGCDQEDLNNLKDNLLSPVRAFVHPYTALGGEVIRLADSIEHYLQAFVPKASPRGIHLQVVPNPA